MRKIKIKKNDIIAILKDSKEKISYEKWVDFIESNKEYFIWYENTEEGRKTLLNINQVPDWAKQGLLQRLNKTNAYSTNKIVAHPFDFIVRYFSEEGIVRIDIEKKMTKELLSILLEMAVFLNGKLVINGIEEIENIDQLA
ncbi:hypothetical protein [Flavobacterium sp. IB48]|uniref:hypothetical protein n=1 Tax=Flavobacterium sp. IB48 TaxID=2779375 RepID=UPI0018E839B7|nr:hypothetical protein [Flavobacterium sp. IB48]MBJ2124824.1 hypothetical protein [Flavobacterium sp. IB48]